MILRKPATGYILLSSNYFLLDNPIFDFAKNPNLFQSLRFFLRNGFVLYLFRFAFNYSALFSVNWYLYPSLKISKCKLFMFPQWLHIQ